MLAAAWLAFSLASRAADSDYSHKAPSEPVAERNAAAEQREKILSEMWQRRILPPDVSSWEPEDTALLNRMRRAEDGGAIKLLLRRLHGLKDLAVEHRPVGSRFSEWRLTRQGFEKYLFLRSQDALDYFDGREIPAKVAFELTDLVDHKLFDKGGLLTDAGENVYSLVLAGKEARWKLPNGEISGSRRHPPAAGKTP